MSGRRPRTLITIKDRWSGTLATIPAGTGTEGWRPGSEPRRPCSPRPWVGPRPSRWRSAGPPESSNPPNAPPWPSATGAVSSPTVNGPWPGAKPIICGTGAMAAPPTWPTSPCCAEPTTAPCTRGAGGCNEIPTAASPRPHRPGDIPAPGDITAPPDRGRALLDPDIEDNLEDGVVGGAPHRSCSRQPLPTPPGDQATMRAWLGDSAQAGGAAGRSDEGRLHA